MEGGANSGVPSRCPPMRLFLSLRNDHHGRSQRRLERETRLELATTTLARSSSNSEYARTRKRPRGAYFPAGSMLFDAELTAVEVKATTTCW